MTQENESQLPPKGSYVAGWRRRSIEDSYYFNGSPRGLEAYEVALGVKREDMQGKIILDLGSSKDAKLVKDIAEAGIDAKVLELSPDYIYPDIRKKAKKSNPKAKMIAGLGQNLPFAEKTFDFVLALHVLEHLDSPETFFSLLKEVSRVLKDAGRAYLGPVFLGMRELMNINKERMADIIKVLGVEIVEEQVPQEYGMEPVYDDQLHVKMGSIRYTRLILRKNQELNKKS